MQTKKVNILIVDQNIHARSVHYFVNENLTIKDVHINIEVFNNRSKSLLFLTETEETDLNIIVFSKYYIIDQHDPYSQDALLNNLEPFRNLGCKTIYFSSSLKDTEEEKLFIPLFDCYINNLEDNANTHLVSRLKKIIQTN